MPYILPTVLGKPWIGHSRIFSCLMGPSEKRINYYRYRGEAERKTKISSKFSLASNILLISQPDTR
jgi:hypothetical protein